MTRACLRQNPSESARELSPAGGSAPQSPAPPSRVSSQARQSPEALPVWAEPVAPGLCAQALPGGPAWAGVLLGVAPWRCSMVSSRRGLAALSALRLT